MNEASRETPSPSEQFSSLSIRVLVKTCVKSTIWLSLAWIATSIAPDAVWPWYVAWTFVAVGMLFSLVMLALAFYSRHQESKATRDE